MFHKSRFFVSLFALSMVLACCVACKNNSAGDPASTGNIDNTTVAQGISYLKEKKFDEAYTCFENAYAKDSTNVDAQFWATLLKITSVSTDSSTVSLMREKIGFVDYPSSMTSLFSEKWFNSRYYGYKDGFYVVADADDYDEHDCIRGTITPASSPQDYCFFWFDNGHGVSWQSGKFLFTPSPTGGCYTNYFTIGSDTYSSVSQILAKYPGSPVYARSNHVLDVTDVRMLPRIEIPSWASSTIDGATGVEGDSASALSGDDYFVYLALNLIERNPNGLNSMVDSVLSGPFGASLDQAFAMIDALPDSAQLTIPNDLLAVYTETGDLPEVAVKLNKAELLAFAGSCKVFKSMIEVLSSYDLNYPLAFARRDMWTDDGESALADLYAQVNPIESGFMKNRSSSARTAAKATLDSAIDDYTDAITLLLGNIEKTGYLDGMTGGGYDSGDVADAKQNLADSQSLIDRLKTALEDETQLYVNPDALNGGSLDELLATTGASDQWAFTPATLYTTDILDPRNFVETITTGSTPIGLSLYGMFSDTMDSGDITKYVPLASGRTDVNGFGAKYFGSAVKLDWAAIGTLIAVPADMRKTFIPLYTQDDPFSYSTDDWKPIAWIMGQE